MWFKNIRVYNITSALPAQDSIEEALASCNFTPCSGQEVSKAGFSYPLGSSGKQYCHVQQQRLFFAVKFQEKILPAAVINEELQPRLDALEQETGQPVRRKEKQRLKEELIQTLLPRAFSRSHLIHGYYDRELALLVINSGSSAKAEKVLALLRKALGSLPALPWLEQHKTEAALQRWLQNTALPQHFVLGSVAELKSPDEEGAKVKFSNHLLTADEVQSHLQDKQVTSIQLEQPETISLLMQQDGSLKRIQYADTVSEQNEELGWDDTAQRLDADLYLMSSVLNNTLLAIQQQVNAYAA